MKHLFIILFSLSFLSIVAQEEIKWMSWNDAVEANKTDKKKIFVDVYTDWCGWCKRMDASTFKDPKVVAYMQEHYYAVKFDAEGKDPITYNGKEYINSGGGRRSSHSFARLLLNGRMSYPTVVVLNENLQSYGPIPGFKPANEMLPILIFLNEQYFEKMKWEEFIAKYKKGEFSKAKKEG